MPATPVRILLLEDSPFDAELIGEHLKKGPVSCRLDRVVTRAEYESALAEGEQLLVGTQPEEGRPDRSPGQTRCVKC